MFIQQPILQQNCLSCFLIPSIDLSNFPQESFIFVRLLLFLPINVNGRDSEY